MGAGAESLKYRFQWTFPIEISPHDDRHALRLLERRPSLDRRGHELGDHQPGPDAQRPDEDRVRPAGRSPPTTPAPRSTARSSPSASRRTKRASSGPARTTAWSTSRATAAQTWQNVTPPDLPEWALISIIEPSPHDPATAYVAATRYKPDDTAPYLYQDDRLRRRPGRRSPTASRTTTSRASSARTRARRGLLYCGTETRHLRLVRRRRATGSGCDGNLPVMPIYDLVVKGTDLVAATHGRSFWILDDITPLHQLQSDARARSGAPLQAARHGALPRVRPRARPQSKPASPITR